MKKGNAVVVDPIENPLLDTYQEAVEKFEQSLSEALLAEGLEKESGLIVGYAKNALTTMILESGLVDVISALVRTCDAVAVMAPSDITDNALKRTMMKAAREQGIRISQAGDLARRLSSSNIEVQLQKMHSAYKLVKNDLDVASRLALQYDGMKVSLKLKEQEKQLREELTVMLNNNPHFQETYGI